jgi:hypothetical protein
VADEEIRLEAKFGKSLENRKTENAGLILLCENPRIQVVTPAIKNRILEVLEVAEYSNRSFDAIMTRVPVPPVTRQSIDELIPDLFLIEMKTTRKPIRDKALAGFWFGATEREFELAARLPDRHLFAFVVLNSLNVYERPFFVLLTLAQLERRILGKRIQFQINLATQSPSEAYEAYGIWPDDELT